MDSSKIFLSLFSLLIVLGMISSASEAMELDRIDVGGYRPITDLTDPYVVGIANFAVTMHNRDDHDNQLVFDKVTSGERNVVGGINYSYKLTFFAKYGDAGGYFQAVVFDHGKSWTLTSFAKSLGKV